MAVIGPSDYNILRRELYQQSVAKPDLKALPALPNESKLLGCFQVCEDNWVNIGPTIKAGMESVLGFSITNALARKIGLVWLLWKFTKGNQ